MKAWLRRIHGVLLAGLACGLGLTAPMVHAALQSLGPALVANATPDGVRMTLQSGGTLAVSLPGGNLVRTTLTPPNTAALPTGATLPLAASSSPLHYYDVGDQVYLVRDDLIVSVRKNPLQVVTYRASGGVISADQPDSAVWDPLTGQIALRKFAQSGEGYYGMGLAGGPINRRGRVMLMRNTDAAGWTAASHPLYSSTPFFFGQLSHGSYGLLLDTPATAWFDFDSQSNGTLTLAAQGGVLDYTVMAGPTPSSVSQALARLIGTAPMPPQWALGYLQSRFGYRSADQFRQMASEFRNRGIPCDGFFLDLDYLDQLKALSWNPLTFPDPVGFNADLAALGFQRIPIVEPLVTVFDPWWPELAQAGHLVSDRFAGGDTPLITSIFLGDVSWVDFTETAARAHFGQRLATFASQGISGLWADLNEPAANEMSAARYGFDGQPRPDETTRNIFALQESAVFQQALQTAFPQRRPFVLSRAGFVGIQRYAANWSGDSSSSFEALQAAVQMSASMGLSGQPLFGHDIGGFLGSPGPELYLRWLQFASVTTFMRTHSNFDTALREPWQWSEPVNSLVKAQIEWRYRMMPMLYSLVAQAHRTGEPVLAPLYYHFPTEAGVRDRSTELMLGSKLLVAPVVLDGARTRTLTLPAGRWLDLATNQSWAGAQTITVPAPLERLPLLAKAGAIIPMGPVRAYATATASEYLLLDIVSGDQGSFDLYEDDKQSTAYQQDAYRLTALRWTETSAHAELNASATGSLTAVTRPHWVQLRGWAKAPTQVLSDGAALPQGPTGAGLPNTGGWSYDAAQSLLLIRAPGLALPSRLQIQR